jgi:hypothetical protein
MGNRQRIKGQTIQWAIDKGHNTMGNRRTDNTMGNRQRADNTMGNRQRIEGQTIQWAIDKEQTIQ